MSFNAYPIQWHEGMFMMPQHFQQNDILIQNLTYFHTSHITPYHWGIIDYSIDPSLLSQGILKVETLHGVMPDGTIVFFPQEPEDSLELVLSEISDKKGGSHTVYLTLPKFSQKGVDGTRLSHRYKTVECPTQDLNTPDSSVSITRLKPILSLTHTRTGHKDKWLLPLCRVARKGKHFSELPYLPPCIYIPSKGDLMRKLKSLAKRVREKILYLQKKVRERARMTSSLYDAQSIWQFDTMRRHLIVGLVSFEGLLQQERLHPFPLYRELIGLGGRCAATQWGGSAPIFSPYQHDNLLECFDEVCTYIEQVLDQIVEAYRVHLFDQKERLFRLSLEKNWVKDKLIIGLKSPANVPESSMVQWLNNAVIVSQSHVERAQENRILGAPRAHIQSAQRIKLIPDRGTILCEITPDTRFIAPEEKLYIFNISDQEEQRPESIVLYTPQQEEE